MKRRYAFVGTWESFGGHGEGIYVYAIDPETGEMKETDHLRGFRNCSILSLSSDKKCLYSTIEDKDYQNEWGAGGGVLALAFHPETGKLMVLNEQSALGACTSYICADPFGPFVVLTNHGSGLDVVTKVVRDVNGTYRIVREWDDSTLVLFRLRGDGSLGDVCDLHMHSGKGAIQVRGQLCSHLHSVNFDPTGQWILACDKGCDCIYVYGMDRERGSMKALPHTVFHARPGTAPRHLEFHPKAPYFFVNHETASAVSSYFFDSEQGKIREIDYQPMFELDSAVKAEQIGDTYGSPADIHVHPNGRFLYSSQRSSYHTGRGRDAITVFFIRENGSLVLVSVVEMDGPCPRGFAIDPDGRFLYVGNQYLDTICRYKINPDTGTLSERMLVAEAATPTCIRIADFEKNEGESYGV